MPRKPPISFSAICSMACWSGAIALFAASISESSATAAIVALAFTIGSWVLDFALAGQPGAARLGRATVADADAAHFRAGTFVHRPPAGHRGRDRRLCRARSGVAASRGAAAHQAHALARLRRRRCRRLGRWPRRSDPRSTSPRIGATRFPAADQRALAELREPLAHHRSPGAGRPALRRPAPQCSGEARAGRCQHVTIRLATTGQSIVGSTGDEAYGEIEYSYGGPRPTRAARPARARSCRCSMRWPEGRFRRRAPARTTRATRWSPTRRPALLWFFGGASTADRPWRGGGAAVARPRFPHNSSKTEVNHEHDQEQHRRGSRLRRPRALCCWALTPCSR